MFAPGSASSSRSHRAGQVGGVGIAAAGIVGQQAPRPAAGHAGHQRHVVGAEIVRQTRLRGGALLHADRSVVELERRAHLQDLAHHETPWPVMAMTAAKSTPKEVSRDNVQTVLRASTLITRLQRREAVVTVKGTNLTLVGSLNRRHGSSAAEIDVKAGQLPCGSGMPKLFNEPFAPHTSWRDS